MLVATLSLLLAGLLLPGNPAKADDTAAADAVNEPASADEEVPELSPDDTFGKSNAEILEMGQSAWFEFYTDHAGWSTAATAMAGGLYTQAARERNDAMDPGYYSEALRQLMYDFGERALSIGPNTSGGGTIWITIWSGMPSDAEDVTYALRGGELPAAEARTTGDVEREITRLQQQLDKLKVDPDASYFDYEAAMDDMTALRADFRAITDLAAELPRADSDRVLGFCLNWLEAVTGYGEG